MITLLHGTLVEATPSVAVLDVGGVGFEVGISGTTAASLPALGGDCRLFCRLQVREDAMTLFGFSTKEERTMFDRLVAVSGVGPRLALAVLSTFTVSQLYTVVMAEDDKGMAKVPGVGKKTAQRLILELKSVFAKDHGLLAADVPAAGQLPLAAAPAPSALDDARTALLSMGFSPQEAELALDGYDGSGMRVEELLAAALKRLGMDA
ncbi:Holliday junction branch migration protein RuvA [Collinsella tanakaei]|uniref:Holliday junction branch migration protein RuvA n=1 Tax=Collinsella tanakaei TaxID=626935 RepID=UPI0025A39A0F|nr:Holliday junction branch migration protein RuvA [Collinsella tanakaei]MDM8300000.1 Holliday junction branch migration protein RuvA [Collinsella tanakaei]